MLISYLRLVTLSFCLFSANAAHAKQPMNLSLLKAEITHYHHSGHYQNDIAVLMNQAMHYLKQRLAENIQSKKKLALVFDVDETTLSNFPEIVQADFAYHKKDFDDWIARSSCPPIKPSLQLYQFARQHHIDVFFITGRTEQQRLYTAMNLNKAGYHNWNGLFLKPNDYHQKSISPYKTAVRKKLESLGYDIVLNIGDQRSDLVGGYADKTIKLPNPYYRVG